MEMTRYRKYVEDSTKGKAIMSPRTYKGDSLIHVWLDRRKLAALSIWLDNNGLGTKFMSDVVRMTLDQVYNALVNSKEINELDTVMAGDILRSKYRVDLNPGGRGERNLLHNMQLNEIVKEQTIPMTPEEKVSYYERNKQWIESSKNDEMLAEAAERSAKVIAEMKANADENGVIRSLPQKECRIEEPMIEPEQKKLGRPKKVVEEEVKETINDVAQTDDSRKKSPAQYQAWKLEQQRLLFEARKKKKDDDTPRPKTDDEVEQDAIRLEQKERELLKALDMPSPKATA